MNGHLPRHTAILASAGSGKTFQLAHRFIRLLSDGVMPQSIAAYTFSRKAAGEIFDSILGRLAEAAASEAKATETAAIIDRPGMTSADFVPLLIGMVNALSRLHIGTLDSLIIGIIRAFPTELGLPPNFSVGDENGLEALALTETILGRLFAHHELSPQTQNRFLTAFRQATYGREEKGLMSLLQGFLAAHRSTYRQCPDGTDWGHVPAIWGADVPWWQAADDGTVAARALLARLDAWGLSPKARTRWDAFLAAAVRYDTPQRPWPAPLKYLATKLLPLTPELLRGHAEVSMERLTVDLEGKDARHVLAVLARIVAVDLHGCLTQTQGIHMLLDQFETLYNTEGRRQGFLTFEDAQLLLAEGRDQGMTLSLAGQADASIRLAINFRLDAMLDHWLLDEFQDTSDLQWKVISNLVDEVVQAPEGERSLFYVGDVKQAIYQWRGGNPRLFRHVLHQYGGRIEEVPMNTSFRSCAPVIDFVNRTFDTLPPQIPAPTRADWEALWAPHQPHASIASRPGYAALIEAPRTDKRRTSATDTFPVVTALLRELDPVARGLTCAVLVRRNQLGRDLTDHLRRHAPAIPVSYEGANGILDNAATVMLLALVELASHPGSTYAWRVLQMSPLADQLPTRGQLAAHTLATIYEQGFEPTLRQWADRLGTQVELDAFSHSRIRALLAAAAAFDRLPAACVDDFTRYVNTHEEAETTDEAGVRVMTIHQSKGLGFDIVIVPDLDGSSMTQARDEGLLKGGQAPRDDGAHWVLRSPGRTVSDADPALGRALHASDADSCFGDLCVLYVALTRARYGLYAITPAPPKTSDTLTTAAYLRTVLSGTLKGTPPAPPVRDVDATVLFECGQCDWVQTHPRRDPLPPAPASPPCDLASRSSQRPRLERVTPSAEAEVLRPAVFLFERRGQETRHLGSAVHELFEAVEWADAVDPQTIVAAWRPATGLSGGARQMAIDQFAASMASTEVRLALAPPEAPTDLWREKPFEVVLGSREWVTGVFDRVHVRRADGVATGADILDYKSDQVSTEEDLARQADHHRPQLLLYRRALSQILALPPETIRLRLIFTAAQRVVDLDDENGVADPHKLLT